MPNRQTLSFPICSICNEPVEINTAKTDEDGKAIHEECYVMIIIRKGASPPNSPYSAV
jgi:hypothetical protein